MEAKELLDLNRRDQFVDKIIAKAVDRYSAIQTNNHSAREEDKLAMDPNLESFVNNIFEATISSPKDAKLVAGIAIEARRLDIVERVIKSSSNVSGLLDYIFELSQKGLQSKVFKNELVELILRSYSQRDTSSQVSRNESWNICYCYFLLNKAKETASVIGNLINGSDDDFLMACQISSDIQEEENQNFTENLIKEFGALPTASSEIGSRKAEIEKILSGEFNQQQSFKFVNQNNRSNKDTVVGIKKFWDNSNSIYHNGMINLYALLHAGTCDDTFLNDATHKQWLTKNSHWARFLSTSCLGTIHKNNPKIGEVINKFFPGQTQSDDYTGGGALYALGLSRSLKEGQSRINYLLELLKNNQKEPIVHGACLALGLIGMSTYNYEYVEALKVFLYNESAIMGEAAAFSIGLIMAGRLDAELISELLDACKNNTHEKIIRGMSFSLALMAYQSEELADSLIEQLLESKDHVVRYGGAYAIGMAYVGTGNTKAVRKLLSITASDVNDDVRRAAVISIGFIMLNQPERVPKIINLLINSYNSQVRFGAAMAIGVACAGSNQKEALSCLEKLQQDNSGFVRQGVVIAMSLVMQQATKNNNPIVEEFKDQLMEKIKKKGEDNIYKFGAMIGLGILEAGGKNSVVTLTSQSGNCKKGAIIGMAMFTQYWYWFPFVQMIGLSLEPTFLIGVNKDLKIPKSFTVRCNTKKSTFDYPPIKLNEDNKNEKDKVVVELSTTRRVKAKLAIKDLAKGKSKMDEETPLEKTVSKMDAEEITSKPAKIEPEEPSTCELSNPCRVLKKQQNYIEFLQNQRYSPVFGNRKRGYVFLKDSRPDEPEEFVDDEPLQAWLIPPPDFYFDESLQEPLGEPQK